MCTSARRIDMGNVLQQVSFNSKCNMFIILMFKNLKIKFLIKCNNAMNIKKKRKKEKRKKKSFYSKCITYFLQ